MSASRSRTDVSFAVHTVDRRLARSRASPRLITSARELRRVVRVLTTIGIRTVRFTGGEPLLRRDLADVIASVRAVGVDDLAITTNGALLSPKRAEALASAGLRRINISLDTLDAERFKALSGDAPITPVLDGIRAAVDAGMQLKTNTVVVRGQDDRELLSIADFVWSIGGVPRFIEVMPMGAGRALEMVPADEIMSAFELVPVDEQSLRQPGIGPADYWLHQGRADQVLGVIAATARQISCASCNRIRLTATGAVRPCLASAVGTAPGRSSATSTQTIVTWSRRSTRRLRSNRRDTGLRGDCR